MIINSDNKIGLIFSKELLEQEKIDTNSELINHIIDIHNNFADQVKAFLYYHYFVHYHKVEWNHGCGTESII